MVGSTPALRCPKCGSAAVRPVTGGFYVGLGVVLICVGVAVALTVVLALVGLLLVLGGLFVTAAGARAGRLARRTGRRLYRCTVCEGTWAVQGRQVVA